MIWAVHNIHTPAVQIDASGSHYLGGPALRLPDPLFTKASKEEAEEERLSRLTAFKQIPFSEGNT